MLPAWGEIAEPAMLILKHPQRTIPFRDISVLNDSLGFFSPFSFCCLGSQPILQHHKDVETESSPLEM